MNTYTFAYIYIEGFGSGFVLRPVRFSLVGFRAPRARVPALIISWVARLPLNWPLHFLWTAPALVVELFIEALFYIRALAALTVPLASVDGFRILVFSGFALFIQQRVVVSGGCVPRHVWTGISTGEA